VDGFRHWLWKDAKQHGAQQPETVMAPMPAQMAAVEEPIPAITKGIGQVRLSHAISIASAVCDDLKLVSSRSSSQRWRWPFVLGWIGWQIGI
jgi:hypothetical protein